MGFKVENGTKNGTEQEEIPNIEQVILDEDVKQNGLGATERQRKYIRFLLAKIGMTTEQYKEYIKAKYGVESSKELSASQVSELIEYLKELAGVQQ